MTLVLVIGGFAFWRFGYPEALACAEELQLFLFSGEYFAEHLAYPGGIATYVGEFVTQFFSILTLGAVLLTLLIVAVQQLTWCAAGLRGGLYALSFVPAVALIVMMGDESVLTGYVVALVVGLAVCFGLRRLGERQWLRWAALGVGIPALFYVAGVGAYTLAAFAIGEAVRRKRFAEGIGIAVLMVVVVIVCYRLSTYPLERIALGICDYRMSKLMAIFACLVGLWPMVVAAVKWQRGVAVSFGAFVGICLLGAVGVRLSYDDFKYRIMSYDLCVRRHDWKGVLDLAKKSEAHSPLELASINFALAMRGELPERMFEYEQINSEGLIPLFGREVFTTMMTTDIYFELGMLNTSRRFAFEAQESIPNGLKSGRLTKRLAEVAIIDGHYGVAKRYLNILGKSFAYGKWANEMEELIKDDAKVSAHPIYGKMRRRRIADDFFYSDREMDQMLGLLFNHDHSNRMALDYLLTCNLLTRDLASFVRYIPLMGLLPDGGRGRIPRAYQEALCMAWAKGHKSFDGMPWPVDENIKRSFVEFAQTMSSKRPAPATSNERIKTSYWPFFARGK